MLTAVADAVGLAVVGLKELAEREALVRSGACARGVLCGIARAAQEAHAVGAVPHGLVQGVLGAHTRSRRLQRCCLLRLRRLLPKQLCCARLRLRLPCCYCSCC